MPHFKQNQGFTLVELMITIIILGIFSAIAIPSFTSLISSNRLQSTTNELASLLQYARSSAAQTNSTYIVCMSNSTWTVKKGKACSSTTNLRNYETPADINISYTSNALPMMFNSNGTTSNTPTIIICKGSDAANGFTLTVRNTGAIRIWSKGKKENGATLTSCTPT